MSFCEVCTDIGICQSLSVMKHQAKNVHEIIISCAKES